MNREFYLQQLALTPWPDGTTFYYGDGIWIRPDGTMFDEEAETNEEEKNDD